MTKAARILGIDPGSRFCGYGLVGYAGPGRVVYHECGVLELPAKAPLHERLGELLGELESLFEELAPTVVAVEGVFSGKNARTAFALGQARGIALGVAGRRGLNVIEYAPATVKRAVAGHGRADKSQLSRLVRTLCGLRSVPRADATDALAIAICHAFSTRGGIARTALLQALGAKK